MMGILNEKIQSDKRNTLAKEHADHELCKIGIDKHVKNKIPYQKTRVQKYFCEDCKVMFDVYNTREDEKQKEKCLQDTSHEE